MVVLFSFYDALIDLFGFCVALSVSGSAWYLLRIIAVESIWVDRYWDYHHDVIRRVS